MSRRPFKGKLGDRNYKKLFVLSVEGKKTEPGYFSALHNQKTVIKIQLLKGKNKSAPKQVLNRIRDFLKQEGLKKNDDAWIVIDKDNWKEEDLTLLHNWSQESENHGLALSNPKFEYWLLLHFEDGDDVVNSTVCSRRLKAYLPNFHKCLDTSKITPDMVLKAIERAKNKDIPPCQDWPRTTGTTVYRLVEKIIKTRTHLE